MYSLKKLHVSIDEDKIDFSPLSQLSKIEDLALQCLGDEASCSEVLKSNRHSLQHVKLTSYSWDDQTYLAFHVVASLKTSVLKLDTLSIYAAQIIAGMVSAGSVKISLHECHNMKALAFRALSSGTGHIQQLTLWNMDDWRCGQLHPISALISLTLIRCSGLTGQELQMQKHLTSLTFISCNYITEACIRKIVKTCPSLEKIEFLAEPAMPEPGHPAHGRLTLSLHGLLALSHGEHLSFINLSGISQTSTKQIEALQACFHVQQNANKALAKILVKHSNTAAPQPSVKVNDGLLQINFQSMPATPEMKSMTVCDASFWAECDTLEKAVVSLLFGSYVACMAMGAVGYRRFFQGAM